MLLCMICPQKPSVFSEGSLIYSSYWFVTLFPTKQLWYKRLFFISSSHLLLLITLSLLLWSCLSKHHTQRKRLTKPIYCTVHWSIPSKEERYANISHNFYLQKLNYDVKRWWRTDWLRIHTSLRLEHLIHLDCLYVQQCNASGDKEDDSINNVRVPLLNLA